MNNGQHAILKSLYLGSAGSLLSSLGVETLLVPAAKVDHGRSKVSMITATGEGITISSMLRMDWDLLINAYALPLSQFWTDDLEDRCCELNNQLVGRMKNTLLRYGVVVSTGVPVLLTGTEVIPAPAPDAVVSEHSFQFEIGKMVLTLTTVVADDLELTELARAPEDEAAMLEGTLELF